MTTEGLKRGLAEYAFSVHITDAVSATDIQCSLFTSQSHTDFVIKCGPYEFPVHKAIITAHSEYFKVACQTNTFQEGQINTITLVTDENDPTCDDPEVVKQMIHYFYHLDYEVEVLQRVPADPEEKTGPLPARCDGNALAHAKVFAAAVKYNVGYRQQKVIRS
jgi:hypothetical protein